MIELLAGERIARDPLKEDVMKRMARGILAAVLLLGGATAQASYDLKERTPAVTAALEGRRDRFSEIKDLKARGALGENNRGYVEVLSGGGDVRSVANAENADRKVIYQAIVEQNGLGASALATVEGVFAGVQRDKAENGERVQEANGKWVTK
jgi:uncharacterized protein YdbL (DUF1318 family)